MEKHVVWHDFYSVGDILLDAQHKKINDVISDLYSAITEGADNAVIKTLLDQFAFQIFSHVQHEERVLHDYKYPDLAQHKILHDNIWQIVRVLPDHIHLSTWLDQLDFVKDLFIEHLLEEDKKYMPYLTNVSSTAK
jgi:hemerythrin